MSWENQAAKMPMEYLTGATGFSHNQRKMHLWFWSNRSEWRQSASPTGEKWLENNFKDPVMLAKVNKAHLTGTMEAIIDYLRSCHFVVRAPLAYVIRETIAVQTYSDYPKYATPWGWNDHEDVTPILRQEQAPLGASCLYSQRTCGRVYDRQQNCLWYIKSDL